MLRENLDYTLNWINKHKNIFNMVPPKAGGMALISYNIDINSTKLAERLRKEKSVFILPGDTYGTDKYFRAL